MATLPPKMLNRSSIIAPVERVARGLCTMAAVWMTVQSLSGEALAQVGLASLACGTPYVIGDGDSLSMIAARVYGDPKRYDILLEANLDVIGPDPNAVAVGMEIIIPCLDAAGNVLVAGAVAGSDAQMAVAIASAGPLQPAELETLFAPIALFPDQVLTPVLVATTLPLEIVKADRFLKEQVALSAKERAALSEQQPWDATVRQLAAGFPDLITRMADHLDWTEQAGEAVLAQTEDVLDAVQRLRVKAQENGYLADNDAQTVEVTDDIIVIAPATPGVVYVPAYDSQVVYTSSVPVSSVYDPYYYGYDDDDWSDALAAGAIIFGGALVLDEIFDDNDWNGGWNDAGSIDWDRGDITIDRDQINIDRDNINIGSGNVGIEDGNRPPLGSGDRPARGDGSRPAVGDRPVHASGRIGGSEGAALAGRDPTFAPDAASRDAARQKIETRKATNPGVAKLPAPRPATQAATRKPTGAATAKARPTTTTRAPAASRPTNVSKPKANRAPSSAASRPSRTSSSSFERSGGSRASAGASRGRSSSGGGGGRRR